MHWGSGASLGNFTLSIAAPPPKPQRVSGWWWEVFLPPPGPGAARGRSVTGKGGGSPACPGPCGHHPCRVSVFGVFWTRLGGEGLAVAEGDRDLHLFRKSSAKPGGGLVGAEGACPAAQSSRPRVFTGLLLNIFPLESPFRAMWY